jgi:hypothetical protein
MQYIYLILEHRFCMFKEHVDLMCDDDWSLEKEWYGKRLGKAEDLVPAESAPGPPALSQ